MHVLARTGHRSRYPDGGEAVKHILFSVPRMGGSEQGYVRQTFTSHWLPAVGE